MTVLLAAGEGSHQDLVLHGGEWAVLIASAGTAILALVVGFALMRQVLAFEQGTPKMVDIAKAIQEGALAYLRRQFRTIALLLVVLAALVFATTTQSAMSLKIGRTAAFVAGCFLSGLTGFIGMSLAVRGNVRTAAAARGGNLAAALKVAFRTGGIAGMFTVGLGLLGATVIVMIYQGDANLILIGFGFGGSLLALFMRVGGGIFTKAADVGADLVGKIEQSIPEDDPRNAAVIADNVGDNVGDCAGMAADLFESYEVTLVASIILGFEAFRSLGLNPTLGVMFPILARAIGVLASIVGIYFVRAGKRDRTAMAPINRGFLVSAVITAAGVLIVSATYLQQSFNGVKAGSNGYKLSFAVLGGLGLAVIVSKLTEYFTSTENSPVQEIADAAETGPATTVLSGTGVGLESSVYSVIAIAAALGFALWLGGGNLRFALYLVALTGMGMLATTGVIVSMDTYGPVADNAAGIAEMSGEFDDEAERVMVSLDAVGNSTKAITKGFAIGSAVIAAVSLFASYIETIVAERGLPADGDIFRLPGTQINMADPKVFIGVLIGGSVVFLFSALAIRAVGRTAGRVVQEVRRQFREHPGIMDYSEKPEYGKVVDICTAASLRELATPALLAILSPVLIGFLLGDLALGGFLGAAILTGQLMAVYLSISGGAWDNAKKYIEDGHHGGKGSEAHKAAVIGDTVGDPFKDTAGPGLNPLIKVMNLVALLVLPVVIKQESHKVTRGVIVALCAIVIVAAVAFSKRKSEGFGPTEVGSVTETTAEKATIGAE